MEERTTPLASVSLPVIPMGLILALLGWNIALQREVGLLTATSQHAVQVMDTRIAVVEQTRFGAAQALVLTNAVAEIRTDLAVLKTRMEALAAQQRLAPEMWQEMQGLLRNLEQRLAAIDVSLRAIVTPPRE